MANVLNVKEIQTRTSRLPTEIIFLPFQGIVRQGEVAQPVFGLRRNRPPDGQVWPRQEFPQRDKLGII
jgi:hypothetical protein